MIDSAMMFKYFIMQDGSVNRRLSISLFFVRLHSMAMVSVLTKLLFRNKRIFDISCSFAYAAYSSTLKAKCELKATRRKLVLLIAFKSSFCKVMNN